MTYGSVNNGVSYNEAAKWCGIDDFQLYLFNEGTNFQSYKLFGAHITEAEKDGTAVKGCRFAVWAPNAKSVSLVGDFNNWNAKERYLYKLGTTGVWYGFYTDIGEGCIYKYAVEDGNGKVVLKTDPFAFWCELRPNTASIVKNIDYKWKDSKWMKKRGETSTHDKPVIIYELHMGSWKMHEDGSFYTYRELARELIPYLKDMGYTHLELMPVTEYPFDGSWGYQVTGYFSTTSRHGKPEEFKYFIDECHRNDISVIMDWVPAHFPRDAHGLAKFDGTPVYEYADTRLGEHKDWGTLVFDYSKTEVISFLTSSAHFWAAEYHVDGLRVDAVSSMLYRDYSRNHGEWLPNKYGGNENIEAIEFLRRLNTIMKTEFPNIMMIAEESTAWGMVTGDPKHGGLGFDYKWNMGWMNDTLTYMSMDTLFRGSNHNLLTFQMCYAFSENYILPLSHDEVVHGKRSLIDKMFGDYDQKFAAYKAMLGYYMSLPGKKLFFMGGENAQFIEWRFAEGLEWHLLENEKHKQFHEYVHDLNNFYIANKPFWEIENSWEGFEWSNAGDCDNSVLSYVRKSRKKEDIVVVIINFIPAEHKKYAVGVPIEGEYEVEFSSDAEKYGGTAKTVKKIYKTHKSNLGNMPYYIDTDIPEYAVIYLKYKGPIKKAVRKNREKNINKLSDKK
ncbi:MAG: 1,4-alpha-glucan branching protein GlgB [Oscillospiraceae bacterium]|nr:1,4-alpha-glucan branching protein GlgB [Oscillospiraceae bacterium]